MLLADEPGLADALLLLAYPLRPPGTPARSRIGHLPDLCTPTLFVHGTADPFGSLAEIRAAQALTPARTALIEIHGAGHDLSRGRRKPPEWAGLVERIVTGFLAFTA